MKVTFYGTRGSISVSDKDFSEFGGNTACVLVTFSTGKVAILDAGTGIRKLGKDFEERGIEQYDNITIALSHTHWDHIQGFPFFQPAYDPRRRFTIAIGGKGSRAINLESVFKTQMQRDFFPVPLDRMGAAITFWQPDLTCHTIQDGVQIVSAKHNHPGVAYGYRITEGGSSVVYCTDVEYGDEIDPKVIALARKADLLIHDAQYSPREYEHKKGWGHSTWEHAVRVAEAAGVRRLALYHHDPEHNDAFLRGMERECQMRFPDSFFAREGTDVDI